MVGGLRREGSYSVVYGRSPITDIAFVGPGSSQGRCSALRAER
jgi:hypothetical protein